MHPLTVGDEVDGFRIEELVGSGGFAAVYRAQRMADGSQVALKVLSFDDGDSYELATRVRIERETSALRALKNPQIVRLLGDGVLANGQYYLVFEFLQGRDLRTVLDQEQRLKPSRVRQILRSVLIALKEAHGRGLLHRDIKPENIYLEDGSSTVKLLDFGITKPMAPHAPSVTNTGELVGTLRYMSPEQLTEKALSPASDLYSLGIVAVEMLLGSGALHGGRFSDQLDRLHTGYLFPAPAHSADEELFAIVQRMTERRPQDRFATASNVLVALEGQAAAERPDDAAMTSPRVWPLVAAACGVIVVGLVGASLLLAEPEHLPVRTAERANPLSARTPEPAMKPAIDVGMPDLSADIPKQERLLSVPIGAQDRPPGCGTPPPFLEDGYLPTQQGRVLGYIPTTYDPERAHPVLVLFHNQDIFSAQDEKFVRVMRPLAEERGVILLAPRDTDWNEFLAPEAEALGSEVETATEELCVDRTRVVAVGHRDGGHAAMHAGCTTWAAGSVQDSFRALGTPADCRNSPRLILASRHSRKIPIDGGLNCRGHHRIPLAEEVAHWRRVNNCSEETTVHADGSCTSWACDAVVTVCRFDGGAIWPGLEPALRSTTCPEEPGPQPYNRLARIGEFLQTLGPKGSRP